MKTRDGPRVRIDAEALERIWHWTELARGEFSCLAEVDDDLLVRDVELFDQVCTQASTDIDQQALARFLVQHPRPERVRAWIHSHGNLTVFWSQQDDQCIEGLANESLLVSIVVNKRHDVRCRIDLFDPLRITLDEVPLEVRTNMRGLRAECAAAFTQHVTEVQAAPPIQVWRQPYQHGQLGQPQVRSGRMFPDDDDFDVWGTP
jgi:hypothetical protein